MKKPTPAQRLDGQPISAPRAPGLACVAAPVAVKLHNDVTRRPENPLLQGLLSSPGLGSMPVNANHLIALNAGLTSLSQLDQGRCQGNVPFRMNGMPLTASRPGYGQANILGPPTGLVNQGMSYMKLPGPAGFATAAPFGIGGQAVPTGNGGVPKPQLISGQRQEAVWHQSAVHSQNIGPHMEAHVRPLQNLLASCWPDTQLLNQPDVRRAGELPKLPVPSSSSSLSQFPEPLYTGAQSGPSNSHFGTDLRPPQPEGRSVSVSGRQHPSPQPPLPHPPDPSRGFHNRQAHLTSAGMPDMGGSSSPPRDNKNTAKNNVSAAEGQAVARGGSAGDGGTDEEDSWVDEPLRPVPCQAMLGLKPGRRLQVRSKEWVGEVIWARMGR